MVAIGQRIRLVVRRKRLWSKAAEQPHHREVKFSMAAVAGGVDEPARTRRIDNAVAGPEITVQARRSFARSADLAQPVGDGFKNRYLSCAIGADIACESGERQ